MDSNAYRKPTKLHSLVLASLFIALDIVFTRFFSVTLFGVERVSLQFLATSLCGAILGPWWGAASAALGDILGMLINSAGLAYYPGFTLTAALRGFVYGLMLHRRPIRYSRNLITEGIVSLVLNLVLNSVWLSLYFGQGYWAVLLVKGPVKLVIFPGIAYITYACLKALQKAKAFPAGQ